MCDSDQYMFDLLSRWGLAEYIDIFKHQKVNAGCLRLLGEDEIRQLIPLAGDRARFKSNLSNWKSEFEPENSSTGPSDSEHAVVEIIDVGDIPADNIINLEQPDTSTFETNEENYNSVLQLLNSTLDGKAILNSGRRNKGLLDQTLRSRLARLVATKELTSNPNGMVPGSRLMKCAHEIAQIFPKESPTIYYIPYVSATPQHIKRNASGKIYDAVINRRKDLRKRGVIVGSSRSSKSSEASSLTSETNQDVPDFLTEQEEAEVEEKLKWLKHGVDPQHLVQNNWTATTKVRLARLQSNTGTVEDYFNQFPALKLPDGYRLLLQDFDHLYKNNKDYLFSNLVLHQKRIIELAKSKLTQLKDKDIKRDIQSYIHSITDDKPDSETNAALLLLPYLTPSTPSRGKGKVLWKPSRTEIRDGYITQVASAADVQTTIASRREKLIKLGRSFQPLVIFTGTIANIESIYVAVAQTLYKVNTLLQGVDTAFKIFQATGAEYPDESYLVWLLIQQAFYNINTKYDKSLSAINTLLCDININN